MNYGELKTLVADTIKRSDLNSVIPTFIEQAQDLIHNTLRAREMGRYSYRGEAFRATPGSFNYSLPDDFLEVRDIVGPSTVNGESDTWLRQVSYPELIKDGVRSSTTSRPVDRYRIGTDGKNVNFQPTPPTDWAFELSYWAKEPRFVSDNDTSELLSNQVDVYLYAACHYAALYVQDLEMAVYFESLYDKRATALNESAKDILDGPVEMNGASTWL